MENIRKGSERGDPSYEGTSSGRNRIRPDPSVLLVEAEDPLRALLRRIVATAGYEVLEARSCAEALMLLSAEARSVRLVVADLAEPGVAGPDGLRRHIPRGAKLLLLSTASFERTEFQALEDGVMVYLSNPFRADVLAGKIRDILEGP